MGWYATGTAALALVEHWNGRAWKKVPGLNPGGPVNGHGLQGVAAASATSICLGGRQLHQRHGEPDPGPSLLLIAPRRELNSQPR